MKGNKKILALAVLLLLIAVSYTTYAIYKTQREGSTTVSAAVWNVAFKNGQTELTDSFTVTFANNECTNTGNHVAAGKIAPGVTCQKTITLDASAAEVDVAYTVTPGTVSYSGSAPQNSSNDFTATLTGGTGTIAYNAATKTVDLTLTVTWGGLEDWDDYDQGDTEMAGQTITVPLTLVAKQVVGS